MSKFTETVEEFTNRKKMFKNILLQKCCEKDVLIWDDNDKILSVKMMANCRRSGAYSELFKNFGKGFTTYIQGYKDAEGHQPVLELERF